MELILPSHFGGQVQGSGAVGMPFGLGAGGELSVAIIYYWQTSQLIVTIDGGVNAGAGVKLPEPVPFEASVTSGPVVGWMQSSQSAGNASLGLGGSVSAVEAVVASVSVPVNIRKDGFNFYEDPVYGAVPVTVYGGAGVGCCGAGVSSSLTTSIFTIDASGVLPWNQ